LGPPGNSAPPRSSPRPAGTAAPIAIDPRGAGPVLPTFAILPSARRDRSHSQPHANHAPSRYPRPIPTSIADILAEADALLEPNRFEDYCVNGLQVPGPAEAGTIATAVSANAETFKRTA